MSVSFNVPFDGTTYTISTPSALTASPTNINKYLGDFYTPTITRTLPDAQHDQTDVRRWFGFIFKDSSHSVILTRYEAKFPRGKKNATVTVYKNVYKVGRLVNMFAINGAKLNTIEVALQTQSGSSSYESGTASCTLSFSGFTPNTPTISNTLSQAAPQSAQFGYVKGFASASWSASIAAKTWTFTDDAAHSIIPAQTLSLSANGATASSGSGTGTRSASLAAKLVSATSLTGTATVTNVLGGSSSATNTLTVQDYIKPSLSALTVSRDSNNHAVITFNWSVAGVNEANTAANPCTSGTVTATWDATDNGTSPTTWNGTKTITADGAVMGGTTGSCTITETAHTYDPDKSYTIAITITDRLGQSSATVTTILASEFYTIDFLAGGQGIALGKAADKSGFDVNMDTFSPPLAGTIQMFAGSTAPNGWLICDGSAVSRTKYARLFSVLGTTYGAGDGSTTFNIPDMRGRFPLGSNSSYALNAKAGSTDAVVVSHTHPTAANGYLYMLTHGALSGGDMGSQSGSGRHYPYQGNRSDGAYWGSQANTGAASSGVSGAGKNMPPYIGINFIIHAGVPTL